MGMLCRFLTVFCLLSTSLFAGPLEEMNEFIRNHPWYGTVVDKAKKTDRRAQQTPFVLLPPEGMSFAASQFVKKDASDADKAQAHEWLERGVEAQIPMSNLGAELLTPLLDMKRRYDSFYHLPVLTLLTQIHPNQNVTDNATDLYGTVIRGRYNDYRAYGGFPPESVFTLLETFFTFSPDEALSVSQKLCEQEPSQGFEKHIRLLLQVQKFDAPYCQSQTTNLMQKHPSRLVQSLQSSPTLRDLTQGSHLSVDSVFAQGLNPQSPVSQQIFTNFIKGGDAFLEPFVAQITGHLNAYLRGSHNPNGCYVQLESVVGLLASKIDGLREGALKAIMVYLKDTDGLKAQFKFIKEWSGQTGTLSSDVGQFLDSVICFKEYEQIDGELFEAFSKVSYHQGRKSKQQKLLEISGVHSILVDLFRHGDGWNTPASVGFTCGKCLLKDLKTHLGRHHSQVYAGNFYPLRSERNYNYVTVGDFLEIIPMIEPEKMVTVLESGDALLPPSFNWDDVVTILRESQLYALSPEDIQACADDVRGNQKVYFKDVSSNKACAQIIISKLKGARKKISQ